MSDYKSTASAGISLETLLGVVFIVLKLTGNIDWSWIWVLSPFWMPIAVFLTVITFTGIVVLIGLILANKA